MTSVLHDYDAAKRREYYLRNRHLKGRTKKNEQPSIGQHVPAKKTAAQRQKELESRVNRLKDRLERLRVVLRAMTEAAQKRSGIDKNTAEKAATKNYQPRKAGDPTSKYVKTQQQKDAAAKAAQKYRDRNKSLTDQVTDLNKKIKAIHERIKRLQRTGSVGVSKHMTK